MITQRLQPRASRPLEAVRSAIALLRWSATHFEMFDPSCSPSSKIIATNSENVGSQFLSLRQRLIRICSPAGAGRPQKPNNGGLFRRRLWTTGCPHRAPLFSSRPIFSEPLDSVILVQRFEPAYHRDFLRSVWLEVGVPLPGQEKLGSKLVGEGAGSCRTELGNG